MMITSHSPQCPHEGNLVNEKCSLGAIGLVDDEVADAGPELQGAPVTKPDAIVLCMLALSYAELSEYVVHGQATVYEN